MRESAQVMNQGFGPLSEREFFKQVAVFGVHVLRNG